MSPPNSENNGHFAAKCAWHEDCLKVVADHRFKPGTLTPVCSTKANTMHNSLRIVIADSEPLLRAFLWRSLTHEGHRVVAVAETGPQLIHECRQHLADLVITEIEMPELDGLSAIHEISLTIPVPAIVVSSTRKLDVLTRASREMVFAFLVKPIKMDDLQPAIWMTMSRYAEVNSLRSRLAAAAAAANHSDGSLKEIRPSTEN